MKKDKKKYNPDFFEYAEEIVGKKRFDRAIKKGDQRVHELRLKIAREKLGLNQTDLEGLTQPEVSKIEKRKDLKISTLEKYAKAMGMKVRIFLTTENEKPSKTISVYG